ncbi:MAG: DUF1624 domain-containing protein [Lachnospiraceae bacterium]|nr:DUF1624 domain-containing protein [Lachnospiraceae bacterium]
MKNKNKIKNTSRLHLIDEYRGFVVLNMIAYHAIWDLVYLFGCDWNWYKSDIGFLWQQWICQSFIFVSGFCWQMGKRHWKRGIQIYVCGMIISLATLIAMPQSQVIFGVLTLIGSSMLLMIALDVVFQKCHSVLGLIGSYLLFHFTYHVNRGYLEFGEQKQILLPRSWYSNMFTTYLGFPKAGFFSTDYFSLIPWIFLFITGYFAYSVLYHYGKYYFPLKTENVWNKQNLQIKSRIIKILKKSICPFFGWIGRNSLVLYMLHQPIIYGVLVVILG